MGTNYLKRGQEIQNGPIRMVILPGIELMEFLPSLQIGMQNLTCSWLAVINTKLLYLFMFSESLRGRIMVFKVYLKKAINYVPPWLCIYLHDQM